MTSTNSPARLAAASLAALFTLTACSSSQVFDFTESSMEPAESIEFRVPDELLELNEGYAEKGVFESITVSAVEAEDPSKCAVEYQFQYMDGGRERLMSYLTFEEGSVEYAKQVMAYDLLGTNSNSPNIDDGFASAVIPLKCATSPADAEATAPVRFVLVSSFDDEIIRTVGFAAADISVMQGGELFVHDSEVKRWQADSNGNWIKN